MKPQDPDDASRIHPAIYRLMIAAALLYALSALLGFERAGDDRLMLGIVFLFFFGVVLLALSAQRQWRNHPLGQRPREQMHSLSYWLDHGLNTFTGHVGARRASVEIMLPLAAVSVGLFLLAIIAAVYS